MPKDFAVRIKQVNFCSRVDDHRMTGKVRKAIEIWRAARNEIALSGNVHRDRSIQLLRQLFVVDARVVAIGNKERRSHQDNNRNQRDGQFGK